MIGLNKIITKNLCKTDNNASLIWLKSQNCLNRNAHSNVRASYA